MDLAAHQFDLMAADADAEAGAAELARGRGVGLAETLEQPIDGVGGDADAGVFDGEAPPGARVAWCHGLRRDAQPDLPARGEFDRVAQQIGQHLAQAGRVAAHPVRVSPNR